MEAASAELKMNKSMGLKDNVPVTIIKPSKGWMPIDLHELWEFRDLLYFFTWRDLKVRYKQTVLGFMWAIAQPFFTMLVFTLFFGSLVKIPSEGVPYPIFAYTALLPWILFADSMNRSTNSIVANAGIIQKVYFPRLLLPISGILSPLVDFCIAFVILIAMMIYYGIMPTINTILLPLFLLLALATSLGVGLWLSALNAKFRDIQYLVPFATQLWMFSSPVVYSATMIPESYQWIYGLNPMAGVIEGFRWALLGTSAPSTMIFISAMISIVVLITGAFYFNRMEKTLADEV